MRQENICVILYGILGDFLTRTPVLREIRRLYPQGKITCVVDPIGAQVLACSPDNVFLHVRDRSRKSKFSFFYNILRYIYFARTNHFDLVIDLYASSPKKLLNKIIRAKKRIYIENGVAKAIGMAPIIGDLEFSNPHHLSVISQQVLRYFPQNNISYDVRPHLDLSGRCIDENERKYLDGILCNKKSTILISLGAGDEKKIPNVEQIVRVLKRVYDEFKVDYLLLRNPGFEYVQNDLRLGLEEASIPVVALEYISIHAILNILQRTLLVIVPDTGVLHLAVAAKASILGLFVYTPPMEVEPSSGIYRMCYKPSKDRMPYGQSGLFYADPNLSDKYIYDQLREVIVGSGGRKR
jgi:ADP-heptose:LPS heptosyltransferase